MIKYVFPLVFLVLISAFLFFCSSDRYTSVIDKEFIVDNAIFNRPDAAPDFDTMLSSFQAGEGLYVMTLHGDFDELIVFHHELIMQHFARQDSLNCSLFTIRDKIGNAFLGRNFDNRDTELFVGLFIPDSGYASIAFVPMIEFQFDAAHPFNPDSQEHRQILLHSAAVSVDGLNENGVTVSVASCGREKVKPDSTKPFRFLLHLTRHILDHATDVQAAIDIANNFNVFDNTQHSLDHHVMCADASGHSVVLEWHDGEMHVIQNSTDTQIATNTKMFQKTDTELIRSCNRYKAIYKHLAQAPDTLSWQYCMDGLYHARQVNKVYHFADGPMRVNTEWSAVFDLQGKSVYVCLNSQYRKVYHFQLPLFDEG